MKQLSTRTIALIALIAIAILALGVFSLQKSQQMPQNGVENEEVEVVENQENIENRDSSTLQDLVENSETITLPEIDTSTWSGHYQSEDLGIEFDYPQEEGWFVRDDLFADSVCIGTTKYDYEVFIEGEGDCVVQVLLSSYSDATANVDLQKSSYNKIALSYFNEGILNEGTVYELFVENNSTVWRVFFLNYAKNSEVRDTFFGILQTLKPISE